MTALPVLLASMCWLHLPWDSINERQAYAGTVPQNAGCFLAALDLLIYPHPLATAQTTLKTSRYKQNLPTGPLGLRNIGGWLRWQAASSVPSIVPCPCVSSPIQKPSSLCATSNQEAKSLFSLSVGSCHSCVAMLEPTRENNHLFPLTTPCLLENRQKTFSMDQKKDGWIQS